MGATAHTSSWPTVNSVEPARQGLPKVALMPEDPRSRSSCDAQVAQKVHNQHPSTSIGNSIIHSCKWPSDCQRGVVHLQKNGKVAAAAYGERLGRPELEVVVAVIANGTPPSPCHPVRLKWEAVSMLVTPCRCQHRCTIKDAPQQDVGQ